MLSFSVQKSYLRKQFSTVLLSLRSAYAYALIACCIEVHIRWQTPEKVICNNVFIATNNSPRIAAHSICDIITSLLYQHYCKSLRCCTQCNLGISWQQTPHMLRLFSSDWKLSSHPRALSATSLHAWMHSRNIKVCSRKTGVGALHFAFNQRAHTLSYVYM